MNLIFVCKVVDSVPWHGDDVHIGAAFPDKDKAIEWAKNRHNLNSNWRGHVDVDAFNSDNGEFVENVF